MNIDKKFMSVAIELAKKAAGMTNPNPIVGAVIVKRGRIIGRGYHKRCGLPHAEINAIKSAGAKTRGATLYVTLEPCAHHGRTPPCTDAILRSGVKRVVIAMRDPNPITNGRGIRMLKARGIIVKIGVLRKKAAELNRPFIKFVTRKLPFIRVKIAESIDGKIATKSGDSRWITGEDSRKYVHMLRSKVDAVIAGANTVIRDDPSLLSMMRGTKQPIRVIVDSMLRVPLSSKIFSTANRHSVIVATTKRASSKKAELYAKKGISIIFCKMKRDRVDLKDLLKKLSWLNVIDVIVEGGGELVASFVEENLVDQFIFFISSKIIGGRDAKTSVEGSGIDKVKDAVKLKNLSVRFFADDIMIDAEAK